MNEMTFVEGFHPLNLREEAETTGGAWQIIGALGIAAAVQIMSDWDNFKNGLFGRPEEKKVKPF
jgi:hypothetical protein